MALLCSVADSGVLENLNFDPCHRLERRPQFILNPERQWPVLSLLCLLDFVRLFYWRLAAAALNFAIEARNRPTSRGQIRICLGAGVIAPRATSGPPGAGVRWCVTSH